MLAGSFLGSPGRAQLFQSQLRRRVVAGSNPLIQSFPLCFLPGAEDARDRGGAAEGSPRRAKNLHAAVMRPLDELLHTPHAKPCDHTPTSRTGER